MEIPETAESSENGPGGVLGCDFDLELNVIPGGQMEAGDQDPDLGIVRDGGGILGAVVQEFPGSLRRLVARGGLEELLLQQVHFLLMLAPNFVQFTFLLDPEEFSLVVFRLGFQNLLLKKKQRQNHKQCFFPRIGEKIY